jgi:DNA-directed RNA polymerase specialized sigma24 family protein
MAALDELGGLKKPQASEVAHEAIVAQSGAIDPGTVRLQVKENRKLSPAEVAELVDAYKAGASQRELTRRFDLHEQTVRAHLRREGVSLRPLRALTEMQEVEVVRLYAEGMWTLGEVADKFGVSEGAVRNVLVRRGVERRPQVRRARTY